MTNVSGGVSAFTFLLCIFNEIYPFFVSYDPLGSEFVKFGHQINFLWVIFVLNLINLNKNIRFTDTLH